MSEGRSRVALGPVLIALAGLFLVAAAAVDALGATGAGVAAPPVPGCSAPSGQGDAAWYQLDERGDPRGALAGYTLKLGVVGSERSPARRSLGAESHAAGPFRGVVLSGSDDGARSEVRLVVAESGCEAVVAQERQVIRRATIDPGGTDLYFHLVDRASRADLGIWRQPLREGRGPVRVLPPLPGADGEPRADEIGRVFATEFAWATDGRDLAVQACGAASCETRVLETSTLRFARFAGAGQGELLGLTRDVLVTYEACAGLPCPVVAVDRASRRMTALAGAASGARLLAHRGGTLLYEPPVSAGYEIAAFDLVSGVRRTVYRARTDGLRLLVQSSRSLAGADVPAGTAVLAPPERLGSARDAAKVLWVTDGTLSTLKGGSR
jgi:hypothetical protein